MNMVGIQHCFFERMLTVNGRTVISICNDESFYKTSRYIVHEACQYQTSHLRVIDFRFGLKVSNTVRNQIPSS